MTFSTAEPLQEGIQSLPPLKKVSWVMVLSKAAAILDAPDAHETWEKEWAVEIQKEAES